MKDQTKEALEMVNALLAFKQAVEAELQENFPDAKAEFSLAVSTVEGKSSLGVKIDTPNEDMKADIADYVDTNMQRWIAELHANGLGVHFPKLIVK